MCRAGRLLSFVVLLMIAVTSPAWAENRVALVIGNANYRNVPSLTNPASDAKLMANTLKTLGFKLVGDEAQIDLDKAGLDSAVRSFGSQLQGADVGLFYYAGHGLQVRGANYLVPVGANPVREADVDFELEDVALVLRQMEASGTRLNLVMLDACRNNPFGGRGLRAIDSGLAQMRAPEGTLISFATQPGNVAQDGANGNSPYSKALAQTLLRPGLGVFDAFNEVGLTVKKATGGEQQPWLSSSPIDGSFYFAGSTKADEARPTPAMVTQSGSPTPTKVATISPVQIVPPPSSEDGRKDERGLAIYNGRWLATASGSCTTPGRGHLTIRDGIISGPDGSGRISSDGHVSGRFATAGLINGRFSGRMSSSSFGSGSWSNVLGCSGSWSLSR
jgi:hypothetical protein